MDANRKKSYQSPEMQVVDLVLQGMLCFSEKTIDWNYDQDQFNPDGDDSWDRPGYGDVIEF